MKVTITDNSVLLENIYITSGERNIFFFELANLINLI